MYVHTCDCVRVYVGVHTHDMYTYRSDKCYMNIFIRMCMCIHMSCICIVYDMFYKFVLYKYVCIRLTWYVCMYMHTETDLSNVHMCIRAYIDMYMCIYL